MTREIDAVVGPKARFMTDESVLYKNLKDSGFEHQIVVHSVNQWVRGECHTQAIDGFWSLLKRGLIGSFHQVSIKHLGRYVWEVLCESRPAQIDLPLEQPPQATQITG